MTIITDYFVTDTVIIHTVMIIIKLVCNLESILLVEYQTIRLLTSDNTFVYIIIQLGNYRVSKTVVLKMFEKKNF